MSKIVESVMMKKVACSLLGALSVGLIATTALAAQFWSTNSFKVSEISVENDSETLTNTFVLFSANPSGISHNCSNTSGYWALGGNQDAIDSMRSTALAAKLAGSSVKVKWINGNSGFTSCSGGTTSGFPVARGLIIQ